MEKSHFLSSWISVDCFHLGFLSLFETGFYSVACASLELMVILLPEPPRERFLSHHAQLQSLSSKAFHSPLVSLPS